VARTTVLVERREEMCLQGPWRPTSRITMKPDHDAGEGERQPSVMRARQGARRPGKRLRLQEMRQPGKAPAWWPSREGESTVEDRRGLLKYARGDHPREIRPQAVSAGPPWREAPHRQAARRPRKREAAGTASSRAASIAR